MSVAWVRLHAMALVIALMIAPASLAQASHVLNHGKRDYDFEITYYKRLAESGDVEAQEALALIYSEAATKPGLTARETPPQTQNYVEALRLLKPLVEAERPNAMARLAVLEAFGLGTPVDNDHALSLARATAEAGEPEAQWLLARLYLSGRGVELDQKDGLEFLGEAMSQSYGPALVDTATIMLTNEEENPSQRSNVDLALRLVEAALDEGEERAAKLLFVPTDYRSIGPRYFRGNIAALEAGGTNRHPAFMHYLGLLYFHGAGMSQNNDEAIRWIGWSAQAGYAPGQHDLAIFYDQGIGVPADQEAAAKMYEIAAKNGEVRAKAVLCHRTIDGDIGTAVDAPRALKLCREAADLGDADALFELGRLYDIGRLVLEDKEKAVSLFLQAAEKGHWIAQHAVGARYQLGLGVTANLEEAVRWFRRGAAQGEPHSQLLLGLVLAEGEGVTVDQTDAYVWLSLALKSATLKEEASVQETLAKAEAVHGELVKSLRRDRLDYADALIKAFKPTYEKRVPLPPGFAPWDLWAFDQ